MIDWEQWNFTCTAGSFEADALYQQCQWRQVDKTLNVPPERVTFTIAQLKILGIDYTTGGATDRHNRLCQGEDLCSEMKI